MNKPATRRIFTAAAVLAAGLAALLAMPARQLSPEQVFAEVSRSVVVVHGLDASGEPASQGSGVAVGKSEVATNCHVIEEAHSIAVRQATDASGGETYRMSAQVLVSDAERDLCLLWVDGLSEPPAATVAEIGSAMDLSIGATVFAVGAPQGLDLSLSQGVVSQLRGVLGKRAAPLVQTDAAISPGSSGGGLFNEQGELVGITAFKWRGESLNFALPIEWLDDLREKRQAELKAAEQRQECLEVPDYECVVSFALFVAQDIKGLSERAKALGRIAGAQAGAGDIDGAFATTRGIEDADRRAAALRVIAIAQVIAQVEAGNIDEAFTTARGVEDADERGEALGRIAKAQATAGDIDGAIATARSIEYAYWGAAALHGIAMAQAKTGDIDGALATARSIERASWRAEVLASIAAAQAKTGDIDGALATARSIEYASDRAGALASIAAARAEAGDIDGALATARSIEDASDRAKALASIAAARTKAGDIDGALATVRSIEDASDRAEALASIAAARAEAGDIDGALATARSIERAGWRAVALRVIAIAQAKAGDIDGALATARSIEGTYARGEALRGIAKAQAKAGDIDGALATARGIEDSIFEWSRALTGESNLYSARASALRDIAVTQAESGEFQAAVQFAVNLEGSESRAKALTSIATQLAASENN